MSAFTYWRQTVAATGKDPSGLVCARILCPLSEACSNEAVADFCRSPFCCSGSPYEIGRRRCGTLEWSDICDCFRKCAVCDDSPPASDPCDDAEAEAGAEREAASNFKDMKNPSPWTLGSCTHVVHGQYDLWTLPKCVGYAHIKFLFNMLRGRQDMLTGGQSTERPSSYDCAHAPGSGSVQHCGDWYTTASPHHNETTLKITFDDKSKDLKGSVLPFFHPSVTGL